VEVETVSATTRLVTQPTLTVLAVVVLALVLTVQVVLVLLA
jgi:hypothetical protein